MNLYIYIGNEIGLPQQAVLHLQEGSKLARGQTISSD